MVQEKKFGYSNIDRRNVHPAVRAIRVHDVEPKIIVQHEEGPN